MAIYQKEAESEQEMRPLLLLLLLLVPLFTTAAELERLFNTTYVQRMADGNIDYHTNVTVKWDTLGRCKLHSVEPMSRLRFILNGELYTIEINAINTSAMQLIATGNNITMVEDQEIGLDYNNDSKSDIGFRPTDLKLGTADITIKSYNHNVVPALEWWNNNKEYLVICVGFIVLIRMISRGRR